VRNSQRRRLERAQETVADRWRAGTFPIARPSTAELVSRWEAVLRGERTLGFRLASIAARSPGLRRMLGLPARVKEEGDLSLDAREARVRDVQASRVGALAASDRGDEPGRMGSAASGDRPAGFPRIGPLLDREIDAALELLRSVPFEELQRRGWHLEPNSFATPLNDVAFLRAHPELWIDARVPAEVDWDPDGQLRTLTCLADFMDELGDVTDVPTEPGRFHWENGTFPKGDAIAYYGIVRTLKPRRVVEIGAGWSTVLLARALGANGQAAEVTLIEPDLRREVVTDLPRAWKLQASPLQLADLSVFAELEPGDVVFYDGSHCVHTASDVNWLFFEVLPRLVPGVWIHVHDIMWPWDYPAEWLIDDGLSWNEQYLVQAFLMDNTSYRVRLAVGMLSALRPTEVGALFPDGLPGGSLWIEKVPS